MIVHVVHNYIVVTLYILVRIRKMLINCVKLDHALYSINYGSPLVVQLVLLVHN